MKKVSYRRKVCPECGSSRTGKLGVYMTRTGKRRRWLCQECGRSFAKPEQ